LILDSQSQAYQNEHKHERSIKGVGRKVMNNLTIKREVTDFLLGSALGVLGLFLLYQLLQFVSWKLHLFLSSYTLEDFVPHILIISAGIVYLIIARYLFYKLNPFVAYGFLLGLFVPLMLLGIVIIELTINPPSEE
jgi:hypothetical protein